LHQPGKLQNVSKNDYGFTTPVFIVNGIRGIVSTDLSRECGASTGGWCGDGALGRAIRVETNVYADFVRMMAHRRRSLMRIQIVQILREYCRGAGFRRTTDVNGRGRTPLVVILCFATLYSVTLYILIL
jgi:hypothetical protein